MKITSWQRRAGEMLPPWYYGLAYEDFTQAYQVFYPIPFNYIIRGFIRCRYSWNRMRSRPTWFGKQMDAERSRIMGLEYDYYQQELRKIGALAMSALKSSTGELTTADFHPEKAKEALGKIQEIMWWAGTADGSKATGSTGWTGPT